MGECGQSYSKTPFLKINVFQINLGNSFTFRLILFILGFPCSTNTICFLDRILSYKIQNLYTSLIYSAKPEMVGLMRKVQFIEQQIQSFYWLDNLRRWKQVSRLYCFKMISFIGHKHKNCCTKLSPCGIWSGAASFRIDLLTTKAGRW